MQTPISPPSAQHLQEVVPVLNLEPGVRFIRHPNTPQFETPIVAQANTQPNSRIPLHLVCLYPGGFAWPASDSRSGRYINCPNIAAEPMGLAVVNDFGDLVPVPSTGSIAPMPVTGVTR